MSGEIKRVVYVYLSDCRDFGKVKDDVLTVFATREEALRNSEGETEKPTRVAIVILWPPGKQPSRDIKESS